jgi:23S rRNA G2445 N2-methylase RlmL
MVDRIRLLGTFGSNKLMAGEVSRLIRRAFEREESERILAVPPKKVGSVGISLPFEPTTAALLSSYHRTSARVLWDLFESAEERLEPLYEELFLAISRDERDFLFQGAKITILPFDPFSVQAGERQVVGAVKNAILDGARSRGLVVSVDADAPDLTFHVRSHETESGPVMTLSLDLAGRPMHQRGYRTKSGEAPLREDVAALLVLFARHFPKTEAVFDPMAGSGTILVEATELAQARPLWTSGRSAQFASHPIYKGAYDGISGPLFGDTRPPLFGVERDPDSFALLERTLTTAGARRDARLINSDFRDVSPDRIQDEAAADGYPSVLLISNPPYGSRLKESRRDLGRLYRDLGEYFHSFKSARAVFIIGEDPEDQSDGSVELFLRSFGTKPRIKKPMKNGPMRALFLSYEL